jgi:hypothetical protein
MALFFILKGKSQTKQEYWITVYNNNFENKIVVKAKNVELKELPDSNELILSKGNNSDTLYFEKELNNHWPCASYIKIIKQESTLKFYYGNHPLKVDSKLEKILFSRSLPFFPDHCSHSSHFSSI